MVMRYRAGQGCLSRPIASALDQVLLHWHTGFASSSFRATITRGFLTSAGILVTHFHDFWFIYRSLEPYLDGAHAGHTQDATCPLPAALFR